MIIFVKCAGTLCDWQTKAFNNGSDCSVYLASGMNKGLKRLGSLSVLASVVGAKTKSCFRQSVSYSDPFGSAIAE